MSELELILTGRTSSHLVAIDHDHWIHKGAKQDFDHLRASAASDGIDLRVLSSFRSFERQSMIWNQKFQGTRAILDEQEKPIDISTLSETQLIAAITQWSAIPGLSRHHWGTDPDIYDGTALPTSDYKVKLTNSEYSQDGIFSHLVNWLSKKIKNGKSFGFYLPYDSCSKTMGPEPWHISYAPIAKQYEKEFKMEYLINALTENAVMGANLITAQIQSGSTVETLLSDIRSSKLA